MSNKAWFKGFTLVEVVIVVGIIAILSVFGVENVIRFQRNSLLDQTAIKVEDFLKSARSKSITAESLNDESIDYYEDGGLPVYSVIVTGSSVTLSESYIVKPASTIKKDINTFSIDPSITITSGETKFARRTGQASGANNYILQMGTSEKRKVNIDSQGIITVTSI